MPGFHGPPQHQAATRETKTFFASSNSNLDLGAGARSAATS